MKASERRLAAIFIVLVVVMGTALGIKTILAWQKRIERDEREAELRQLEVKTLMAEAPVWTAMGEWLAQVQPAAESELKANEGLLDQLTNSALSAGLTIPKTQIEPTEKMPHYRQFGVTLTLNGDFAVLMRWVHGILAPDAFYVVPQLRITPDKDDPSKVTAQVRIWRWYRPEIEPPKEPAPATNGEAPPAPAVEPQPAAPVEPPPAPTVQPPPVSPAEPVPAPPVETPPVPNVEPPKEGGV